MLLEVSPIKTAIIVDDEELSRDLIKYLIDKFHLPIGIVGQAASGDEALALIHSLKPDLVFLDIEMPKYNGIKVMEAIKASYQGSVKFIVITAYGYFDYAQAALRLGAKDILLKPIESRQFLETMERVMGYKYTDNQSFNEVLEYIGSNYTRELGLNECARELHMSPSHISRMFRKYAQVSFITYVNKLRIEKSLELLKETDLSVKEISQRVGYNNLNYFYKNFKTIAGVTPKEFRGNG